MNWFLDRLNEPSTWQGIAAVISVAGVNVAPELQNSIITAGVSVISLINVIKKG